MDATQEASADFCHFVLPIQMAVAERVAIRIAEVLGGSLGRSRWRFLSI